MIYELCGREAISYTDDKELYCEAVSVASNVDYFPYFDGLTQYVLFSEPFIIPAGIDFEIEVVAKGLNSNTYQSIFSGSTVDNFYRLLTNGEGIQVYAGGYGVTWVTTNFDPAPKRVYSLRRVGTDISILVDGNIATTRSGSTHQVDVDRLMRSWSTSSRTSGLLESFRLYLSGVLTNEIVFNQRDQSVQVASIGNVNATIVDHAESMWMQG